MACITTLNLTVAVLAKPAVPGRVKTRLIGRLSPQQAAAVHQAMLECVLERLAEHLPEASHILAVSGLGAARPASMSGWKVMDQGSGDLGQRLDNVWRALGAGPIAFFGADSPDVPAEALRGIAATLETADAAIGRTCDGGYWTLAANRYLPALLRGIDWGGPNVYHQTTVAAADAGVSWAALPAWHDVDRPDDLAALRRRLQRTSTQPRPEPALIRLRDRLRQVCEEPP